MDRQIPLPRFRLDSDSSNEQNASNQRSTSHVNPRSQIRTRQSPCSDLQSTTIPEEHIYNGDHQSNVLTDQSCSKNAENSKTNLDHQRLSKGDSIKLCRQRCQSHYKSLDATQISSFASLKLTANHRKTNDGDEREHEEGEDEDDDDDEIIYRPPPRTKYRYSLPDASPATLALRNILKRNKTLKSSCFGHGLPSNSSHSLSMSLSNANPSHSSPISTFRNFLSLVKIPSSKSNSNSTTSHHSSLTTLTNATGSSSTTLNQPILSIPATMLWHFEVRTYLDEEKHCLANY